MSAYGNAGIKLHVDQAMSKSKTLAVSIGVVRQAACTPHQQQLAGGVGVSLGIHDAHGVAGHGLAGHPPSQPPAGLASASQAPLLPSERLHLQDNGTELTRSP